MAKLDKANRDHVSITEYFTVKDDLLSSFWNSASGKHEQRYNTLEVVDVYKISYDEDTLDKYESRRNASLGLCTTKDQECARTDMLASRLRPELKLRPDLNEKMLFHGTLAKNVDAIVSGAGFDPDKAGSGSFGRGWYFAEEPGKSDNYADSYGTIPSNVDFAMKLGTKFNKNVVYMMVVRVATGCAAHVTRKSYDMGKTRYGKNLWFGASGPYSTPPQLENRYSSLIYDADEKANAAGKNTSREYREFVVYERERAIPAYVIAYRRTNVSQPNTLLKPWLDCP